MKPRARTFSVPPRIMNPFERSVHGVTCSPRSVLMTQVGSIPPLDVRPVRTKGPRRNDADVTSLDKYSKSLPTPNSPDRNL